MRGFTGGTAYRVLRFDTEAESFTYTGEERQFDAAQ